MSAERRGIIPTTRRILRTVDERRVAEDRGRRWRSHGRGGHQHLVRRPDTGAMVSTRSGGGVVGGGWRRGRRGDGWRSAVGGSGRPRRRADGPCRDAYHHIRGERSGGAADGGAFIEQLVGRPPALPDITDRWRVGCRTPSRKTWLAAPPVIWRIGRTVTPGACINTDVGGAGVLGPAVGADECLTDIGEVVTVRRPRLLRRIRVVAVADRRVFTPADPIRVRVRNSWHRSARRGTMVTTRSATPAGRGAPAPERGGPSDEASAYGIGNPDSSAPV